MGAKNTADHGPATEIQQNIAVRQLHGNCGQVGQLVSKQDSTAAAYAAAGLGQLGHKVTHGLQPGMQRSRLEHPLELAVAGRQAGSEGCNLQVQLGLTKSSACLVPVYAC